MPNSGIAPGTEMKKMLNHIFPLAQLLHLVALPQEKYWRTDFSSPT